MTVTFTPASTFGRYSLRRLFESDGTQLQAQLLNVPVSTPGDRTTWTWEDNWKNYVIPGLFTGTYGPLNMLSTGATPPSSIALYEEATMVYAGAYYDGEYYSGRYTYIYNPTGAGVEFTHCALFISQPTADTAEELVSPNQRCVLVTAANSDETASTLPAGYYAFNTFGIFDNYFLGGATVTTDTSLQSWAEKILDTPLDQPYPLITDYTKAYYINDEKTPFIEPAYKNIVGSSSSANSSYILAELLNVTGTVPAFDAPWSEWAAYRINRYATSELIFLVNYTPETATFQFVDGPDTYEVTFTATKLIPSAPADLLFTPPLSGSYTYTHVALFTDETSTPPPAGSSYTYSDPDKFLGVLTLASSVTMTTASTPRAYPVNVSFTYQPTYTVEVL